MSKYFEDDKYILKRIDPRELTPYQNNSRIHSADVIERLADSMIDIGFNRSVSIDSEHTILAGHKSVLAAIMNIERGHTDFEEIPVTLVKNLTDVQRRAFVLAENKHNELSEWDKMLAHSELEFLQGEGFDVDLTGFDFDLDFGSTDGDDYLPPDAKEFDEDDLETDHECPKCGFEF